MNQDLLHVKKFLWISITLGLLVAVFPWTFSFSGEVLGIKVSLRALGNGCGFVIFAIGGAVVFSQKIRGWASKLQSKLDRLTEANQRLIRWIFIFIYALGVISHKLKAQESIGTHALDLGFFSNICWNTSHGFWFVSSLLERNFMGLHANWILWPLSFFYKIWPGAEVLLISQALFVAGALPFLWKLVQKILSSFTAGMIFSVMFAASPFIGHYAANDFHPDGWQLPCLTAGLLAWKLKRPWTAAAAAGLGLLAKEDVSCVLAGFAILMILDKNSRQAGIALFTLATAALAFHMAVFIPSFVEGPASSVVLERYHFLGDSFGEIVKNFFTRPELLFKSLAYEPSKYWRLLCVFFPAGGLTFLSPLFIIPPIISVLPHILSQASIQLDLADIYAIPTQPFVFAGAAYGVKVLFKKFGTKIAGPLAGAGLVIAGIGIITSPRYYRFESRPRIAAFKELKRLVPPNASVQAQQNLYPHFDSRRFAQLYPGVGMLGLQRMVLTNPEFIIADRIGNAIPYDHIVLAEAIQRQEADQRYEKVFEKENFLLFRRIGLEEPVFKDVQ